MRKAIFLDMDDVVEILADYFNINQSNIEKSSNFFVVKIDEMPNDSEVELWQ